MKITVKDGLKITPLMQMELAKELILQRPVKDTFNYSLITFGALDLSPINIPIVVKQQYGTNRKGEFSPLEIIIEKYKRII